LFGRQRGSNDDGAGAGRGEAVLVGGDVVDGVGGYLGRAENNAADQRTIEERADGEVVTGAVFGGRAEVLVRIADVEVRRVLSGEDNDGRGGGSSGRRICKLGGRCVGVAAGDGFAK
jgi:hypothetical protein